MKIYHPALAFERDSVVSEGFFNQRTVEVERNGRLDRQPSLALTPDPSLDFPDDDPNLKAWWQAIYAADSEPFMYPIRFAADGTIVFPFLEVVVQQGKDGPDADKGGFKESLIVRITSTKVKNLYWEKLAPYEFKGSANDLIPQGGGFLAPWKFVEHRANNLIRPYAEYDGGKGFVIPGFFAQKWIEVNKDAPQLAEQPTVKATVAKPAAPVQDQAGFVPTIVGGKVAINLCGKTITVRKTKIKASGSVRVSLDDGKVSIVGLPEPQNGIVYYVPASIKTMVPDREDVVGAK